MKKVKQLRLLHHFDGPLTGVVATLDDAEYAHGLVAAHSFFAHVEVLAIERSAKQVRRTLRYHGRPFLARLGPLSPPAEWFVWTEHSLFDRDSASLRFENVPELPSVRAKFVNRGSMQFRARYDEHGAVVTTRESRFELALNVARFYAPMAEAALALIASQLESSLDEEARFLRRFVAGPSGAQVALSA
jgi:hypothetical protein